MKVSILELPNFCLGKDFTKHNFVVKFVFGRSDLGKRVRNKLAKIVRSMQLDLTDHEMNALMCYDHLGMIYFFFETEEEAFSLFKKHLALMEENRDYFGWVMEDKQGVIHSNT